MVAPLNTMPVKTVATTLTTDAAGNVVESVPVYLSDVPVANAGENIVAPTQMVESAVGRPIRIVPNLYATNSAGMRVDAMVGTGLASLASLLFGAGEDGFLFGDFAEMDEMFTAINGQTNVAVNDDVVGLALDDHSWGDQTLAQVMAVQPDLVTNGGFGADVSWSKGAGWTIAGGVAIHAPGTASNIAQALAPVVGAVYWWTANVTVVAGSVNVGFVGAGTVFGYSMSASGAYSGTLVIPAAGVDTLRVTGDAAFDGTVDNVTLRRIPGNHASQGTSANRPLWKANAGKPYLLFDGTNDALIPPFYPNAASGLSVAVAFNNTTALDSAMIGGGTSTNNKRFLIGLDTTGRMLIAWGTQVAWSTLTDMRNANHIVVVTGDATGRDVWLDGVNITGGFVAATDTPDGTGGALTLAGRQSTVGGVPTLPMAGKIPAALAINRRVTPAEIARITADFQRTF